MKKTLGGDRLGSGNKMQVELHGYERSNHDLSYIWRSTMGVGTLVPFIDEVALPGDTFDIELDAFVNTHPTIGPLFGSMKLQMDVFLIPIRLYQAQLHNNELNIGRNMSQVKLPIMELKGTHTPEVETPDLDNAQINPSCILSYFGIRGVGRVNVPELTPSRYFNALKLLAYWDTHKNYYANKQEEDAYVIHTPSIALVNTVQDITTNGGTIPQYPAAPTPMLLVENEVITINYVGTTPIPSQLIAIDVNGRRYTFEDLGQTYTDSGAALTAYFNFSKWGNLTITQWNYVSQTQLPQNTPQLTAFGLDNIDEMRSYLLYTYSPGTPVKINDANLAPYSYVLDNTLGSGYRRNTQEGLAVKTYQSDLFNNWVETEWLDGAGGINEITAIDTSSGSFNIDTLILSRKVYNMLMRIAVSGGTYDDWLDVTYTHERFKKAETPMYQGGLIKEIIFQEVVSNSESQGSDGTKPLGTLAGKGMLSNKHKGGKITIKVDEPSLIMGIVSITPRIDYSQGNKWDNHLLTMDDFHKPQLDEIGFQDLITEQMAWWDTAYNEVTSTWTQLSAGKQPAWLNYMTNVNKVYGNFAIADNEMWMTLNRRYEYNWDGGGIMDLTTYIDPAKYNWIFAEVSRDAQNFWVQIAVDMFARRKMSAKLMPNL